MSHDDGEKKGLQYALTGEGFQTIKAGKIPPPHIQFNGEGGVLLKISNDGTVSFSPNLKPAEGAEEAWGKFLDFASEHNSKIREFRQGTSDEQMAFNMSALRVMLHGANEYNMRELKKSWGILLNATGKTPS